MPHAPSDAYAALLAHHARIAALSDAAAILSWDQETHMPPAGAAQRAASRGALAGTLHALRTDPRIGDWIATAEDADLDEAGRADLREARRSFAQSTRVPADLAEALAREASATHHVWAEARAADDPAPYLPALARMISLRREEAQALSDGEGDPYDALLDQYEPGASAAEIDAVFARLRAGLVALLDRLLGAPAAPPRPAGTFPAPAQLALARAAATACGYDWSAGRLDLAVHPFSSGGGRDVRITTRVSEDDPMECLYATLHETGHALYELGVAPELHARPVGSHASMGVHESQSRLWENHVGRSAAAAPFLHALVAEHLGETGLTTPQAFHAAANALEPGFIRTAADEAQYDVHILMRFDLERALLSGDLPPEDLPGAWDDRFEADFGRRPPDAAQGCLQDVHWSEGLIGYFPTYTLGNMGAAALMAKLRADEPALDAALAAGDFSVVLDWLRPRIHAPGRIKPVAELWRSVLGEAPDETPLLAHLAAKFEPLHGLA
ncbi:MAG: carboxypeptidase M32 [Pseudomonadota bacterium]